jgi:acetylornithine deacetylase/succinyl-diaminopimelate desuccinylase-like protein
MLDQALAAATHGREKDLADLVEELRIPSVSTLPEHRDDVRRNAEWLVAKLQALGFETSLTDVKPDGHPVLRADWIRREGAPTVTLYGHYDVQPPDPLDEWDSPPFEPVVKDGVVYARGCADNKGNHMATLKAVEHWMSVGGPPCNVRFLIEGEEEIGGESLPIYVREHADELDTACVVVWDGGYSADDHPSLVVGLRGLLYTDVEVQGTQTDVHSGFGGVAPNACDALASMLANLHDDKRRVTVPGFYDDVVEASDAELELWHRDPDGEATFKKLFGTEALVGEEDFGLEERTWTRPSLEINGMVGGFTGHGAKTVIAARARAKVSMRLVPNQDPEKILAALRAHCESLIGPAYSVTVKAHTSSPAVQLGVEHHAARAAMAAWKSATQKECVVVRTGGSIPVCTAFSEALGVPMIVSGVATKDSGAHGPNEKLYVDHYYAGIDMIIRFLQEIADDRDGAERRASER